MCSPSTPRRRRPPRSRSSRRRRRNGDYTELPARDAAQRAAPGNIRSNWRRDRLPCHRPHSDQAPRGYSTAVRAMKAGATDFLEKPYSDHALLGSIEVAFARENQHDRDHDIADAIRRIATLSPREREVLDGLLAGRPNKLIAYDLGISVRTAEVHRARMMERLGMRQLADVIRLGVMARLNGQLPPARKKG